MNSLLNKVDDLVSLIDINSNALKDTRMVFIVGASGAGKTTLAENFRKSEKDFIHFDGDMFMFGTDPIKNCGGGPSKEEMDNRSAELKAAYDLFMDDILCVNNGQKPRLDHWQPLYELMIPQIKEARLRYPNKHIAISHGVYPKVVRDYIRSQFGNDLSFIIINTDKDVCTERRRSRLNDAITSYGAEGVEEFFKMMGTSIKEQDTKWSKASHGFEMMSDDEANTFQIDASKMTKEEVCAAGKKILRQIGINKDEL